MGVVGTRTWEMRRRRQKLEVKDLSLQRKTTCFVSTDTQKTSGEKV